MEELNLADMGGRDYSDEWKTFTAPEVMRNNYSPNSSLMNLIELKLEALLCSGYSIPILDQEGFVRCNVACRSREVISSSGGRHCSADDAFRESCAATAFSSKSEQLELHNDNNDNAGDGHRDEQRSLA
jgi:hypothetical protein